MLVSLLKSQNHHTLDRIAVSVFVDSLVEFDNSYTRRGPCLPLTDRWQTFGSIYSNSGIPGPNKISRTVKIRLEFPCTWHGLLWFLDEELMAFEKFSNLKSLLWWQKTCESCSFSFSARLEQLCVFKHIYYLGSFYTYLFLLLCIYLRCVMPFHISCFNNVRIAMLREVPVVCLFWY